MSRFTSVKLLAELPRPRVPALASQPWFGDSLVEGSSRRRRAQIVASLSQAAPCASCFSQRQPLTEFTPAQERRRDSGGRLEGQECAGGGFAEVRLLAILPSGS